MQELENCLFQIYTEYPDCLLIVCGDFNARTGNLNVGDACKCSDIRSAPFEFRDSFDVVINDFGYELLSTCLGFDLIILNGCIEGDTVGGFTYISPMGNSVIDYFLVSRELVKNCKSLLVRENVLTSHLCLEMCLECYHVFPEEIVQKFQICRHVWDPNMAEQYSDSLMSYIVEAGLWDKVGTGEIDTDGAIVEFGDCVLNAAEPMKKYFTVGKSRYRQPWYDNDCFVAKQTLKRFYRQYLRACSPALKETYMRLRNEYKRLIREKKGQPQKKYAVCFGL